MREGFGGCRNAVVGGEEGVQSGKSLESGKVEDGGRMPSV